MATILDQAKAAVYGENPPKPETERQQDAPPEPQPNPPAEPPARGTKEMNLRQLAQAKEDAERRAQEIEARYKALEEKANAEPDPKLKRLFEFTEVEYENDPERLIEDLLKRKEESQTWQQKLEEKDKEIEKISIVHSEAYKRNVETPRLQAIGNIEALLDGDATAINAIGKIILDDKGILPTQPLDAKQKQAIKAALSEAGIDTPITEVWRSINEWKDVTAKGIDYVKNFQTRQKEEQDRAQSQQIEQQKRLIEQQKLVRVRSKNEARQSFPEELKEVSSLLKSEEIDDIFTEINQELEDTIEGRSTLDWKKAYLTNAKARAFDKLMANGALPKAIKAMESVQSMKTEGDGTRPRFTGAPTTPGSGRTALDQVKAAVGYTGVT
jgi:hypothetical protein